MRSKCALLFGLLSLAFFGWSVSTGLAAEPIKIGIISPMSGNYGDHGALERAGMQMALDEYGGKVLGRSVQFILADSETNPDAAARRARRLIEVDGVKILIGGVSSSVGVSVGAVAEEKGALH